MCVYAWLEAVKFFVLYLGFLLKDGLLVIIITDFFKADVCCMCGPVNSI